MPVPFSGAPIVPATCVPWPSSSTLPGSSHEPSGSLAQSPSMTGSSLVKLRLSALSKLGAMSGCEPSMPVSMMPTRTSWLPGCVPYEPSGVACIIRMSHWPADSGSPPGSAAAWTVSGALMTGPRSDSSAREAGVFGTAPIARLAAAPASARVRAARVAKLRERETTVASPMRRFSRTIRPPLRWIARTNSAWLAPRADRTT